VQDAIDAIVLAGSPDTYKRQMKDERKVTPQIYIYKLTKKKKKKLSSRNLAL
jgi:hypothetical protein